MKRAAGGRQTPSLAPLAAGLSLAAGALLVATPAAHAQLGEGTFKAKCASCHTVGGGKLVGPDLQGVGQRRERAWVLRFIQEPDKVIAQGDPVARKLLADHNNVPMPNLGITGAEAEGILAYLDAGAPANPAPEAANAPAGADQQGQKLFSQTCSSCHTIGGGVTVGPDLQGVTQRRERPWLEIQIKSPSVHRDRNDPITRENAAKFAARMPDLGLADQEVAALIAYLDTAEGAALPEQYLPTLALSGAAIVGLTLIGLNSGKKKVDVR